jgi:hypothetical protein
MYEIRRFGAIEPRDFSDCPAATGETVAAPAPADRAQCEAFLPDLLAMRAHASRHDDVEPGGARGAGDWQPMRAEIPILGDEEEELRPVRGMRYAEQWRRRYGGGDIQKSHGERARLDRLFPFSNAFAARTRAQSGRWRGRESKI